MISVKIKKLYDDVQIPEQMTIGSAGFDIRARLDNINCTTEVHPNGSRHKYIILQPLQRIQIGTGLAFEIPVSYECQIRPRSGQAIKHGITLINCLGTIDNDFRNEICLLVVNLSNQPQVIEHNMRLAQCVFNKYESPIFELVDELSKTERNGGFGSTDND